MSDNFITISDLEVLPSIEDTHRLLIDDMSNNESDTKAASVAVLKTYLVNKITPSINKDTKTWFIGDEDTQVSTNGIDIWKPNIDYSLNSFVAKDDIIYRCTISPQADKTIFNPDEWSVISTKIEYATDNDIEEMMSRIWEE